MAYLKCYILLLLICREKHGENVLVAQTNDVVITINSQVLSAGVEKEDSIIGDGHIGFIS